MNYEQLKQIEHSIALAQAQLGVLRAQVKMNQGVSSELAQATQNELDSVLKTIDEQQRIYTNIKR